MTIGKASGEAPREVFRTTEPSITFILSYSSYHLEISAFNNASTSPALRHTIRRREDRLGERLFVLLCSVLVQHGRLKPLLYRHGRFRSRGAPCDSSQQQVVYHLLEGQPDGKVRLLFCGVDGARTQSCIHVLLQSGQLQDADFKK